MMNSAALQAQLASVSKYAFDLAAQLNGLNQVSVSASPSGGGGGEAKSARIALRETAFNLLFSALANGVSVHQMSAPALMIAADAVATLASVPDELSSDTVFAASVFLSEIGEAVGRNASRDIGPNVVNHLADAIGRLANCLAHAVQTLEGQAAMPPPPPPPPSPPTPPSPPSPPSLPLPPTNNTNASSNASGTSPAGVVDEVTATSRLTALGTALGVARSLHRATANSLLRTSRSMLEGAMRMGSTDSPRSAAPPMLSGHAGASIVLRRVIDHACDASELVQLDADADSAHVALSVAALCDANGRSGNARVQAAGAMIRYATLTGVVELGQLHASAH